jgi:hypothetical protein
MSAQQLAKSLYEAFDRGDVAAVLALFTDDFEWYEAEGHPYTFPDGRPFIGGDEIVEKLFMRLGTEWETFAVSPSSYLDAEHEVVVQGRYVGVFEGRALDAQFCHIWTERAGLLCRFQQYTDTDQFQRITRQSRGDVPA